MRHRILAAQIPGSRNSEYNFFIQKRYWIIFPLIFDWTSLKVCPDLEMAHDWYSRYKASGYKDPLKFKGEPYIIPL